MSSLPGSQIQLNRRLVVGNIATLFSGSALAQGMTALALLLTARQLEADQYGQYASSLVLATFASIVFSLGLDIWLLREGGRSAGQLDELVGSVLGLKLVVGFAWLVGFSLLAPYLNGLTGSNSFPSGVVRAAALTVWLDSLFASLLGAFKASLRNKFTSLLEASSDFLLLLSTGLLIYLGVRQAATFLQIRALVLGLSLIAAALLVRRTIGLKMRLEVARRAFSASFAYAASEFLAWTSMRLDVLIVAILLGKTAAGLYSPAVGLANALFLVPAAVYVVILPVLSNLFSQHVQQAWKTAGRSLLLLAGLGGACAAGLLVAAPWLVSLLGASFSSSLRVLQILSPIVLIHSLSFGMAAILVAAGLQARRTVVQAIAVGANGLLNLLVAPWLGINAVAGVYVVTEIILLAGYSSLAWKCYRSNPGASPPERPNL